MSHLFIIPNMTFQNQIVFKILSKLTGLQEKKVTDLYIFCEVNLCVTLIHYPKYDIPASNSLQDIKQNHWPIKLTYKCFTRSIFVSH